MFHLNVCTHTKKPEKQEYCVLGFLTLISQYAQITLSPNRVIKMAFAFKDVLERSFPQKPWNKTQDFKNKQKFTANANDDCI